MSRKKHCYHYLYKTTNLINNKYYYGMHSTSKLDDGYLGSGLILRRAIRKYGKDNFKREIIEMFDTREDLIQAEIDLITNELLYEDLCMNLKQGGSGGFTNEQHKYNCTLSASIINIGNQYYKNKVSVKDNDGNTFSISVDDTRYLSGELKHITKNTISIKDKDGNCFRVDKDDSRYLSGELVGIWKNKTHSDDSKLKIKQSKKGTGLGDKNSQFGTCWITRYSEITKDNENKKIKKEELDQYINNGWNKGRR